MLNGYLLTFPVLFVLSVGIYFWGTRTKKKTPKKQDLL